jgi:hypothetical protein
MQIMISRQWVQCEIHDDRVTWIMKYEYYAVTTDNDVSCCGRGRGRSSAVRFRGEQF